MKLRLLFVLPMTVIFSLFTNSFYMRRTTDVEQIQLLNATIDNMAEEPQVIINGTRMMLRNNRTSAARIPNPQSLTKTTSFSSCLLIRDDNDILNEWIAYHYFVLKLRYLIVAVDPLSETSPSEILDKWRDRMVIQVWNDTSYMPKEFLEHGMPPQEYMMNASALHEQFDKSFFFDELLEVSNHRYRQRVFLTECIKSLKVAKRTWMIHIDTDEYVIANKLLRRMQLKKYVQIPPMETPGSVLTFLQNVVAYDSDRVSYPCISMMRILFGAMESTDEKRNYGVPIGLNASKFETLRWRYHALPHNRSQHGYGKVILDVSRIPLIHLQEDIIFSIHRPFPRFCRSFEMQSFNSYREFPITVNHFLGSWERYSARNDKRRSYQSFKKKANQAAGTDDGTKPWIRGFVQYVGYKNATKLLGRNYLS